MAKSKAKAPKAASQGAPRESEGSPDADGPVEAEILPAPPDEVADEDASDDEGLDDETIDVEARSKGDDDDAQGDAVDDVLA